MVSALAPGTSVKIRILNIENTGTVDKKIEAVDCIHRIIPYGMDVHCITTIPRHIEGMIEVAHVEGLPLFRLVADL